MLDLFSAFNPFGSAFDYMADACQRTILFWDVMRKRGNQAVEHVEAGKPPVLSFRNEVVMDGRTLERPCNYLLLRILPSPESGVRIDPAKRPFIIVDPRAGHGPGIGGFKPDSQIGNALEAGHPCYFISFLPEPVPGQTLGDVGVRRSGLHRTGASRCTRTPRASPASSPTARRAGPSWRWAPSIPT